MRCLILTLLKFILFFHTDFTHRYVWYIPNLYSRSWWYSYMSQQLKLPQIVIQPIFFSACVFFNSFFPILFWQEYHPPLFHPVQYHFILIIFTLHYTLLFIYFFPTRLWGPLRRLSLAYLHHWKTPQAWHSIFV